MALFTVNNVGIAGIAACVPKNNISNNDASPYVSTEDLAKIIKATGIENRRVVTDAICTSDLCQAAAEKLLEDLGWAKDDISILVVVTQTPDYILPVTSALLQDRLGLPKTCLALDISLGCSGYVYGLSVISSMLSATGLKKGLLLAGDTISKFVSTSDRSTYPLFGDSGTATGVIFDTNASPIHFNLQTDGSGYEAIIIRDGGNRNRFNAQSLDTVQRDAGIAGNACQLELNGMDVFNFGISHAPKSVKELLAYTGQAMEDNQYYVFHQANLLMNETVRKKLKLTADQVPYTLKQYGNTSSATIPLTIVSELKDKISGVASKVVMCGFGVGLSWGSLQLTLDHVMLPAVIEI